MKKYLAGAVLSLGLLIPSVSSAAGLSGAQIQAILSLLSSFGADSTVVQNVQTALGGSGSGNPTAVAQKTPSITLNSPGAVNGVISVPYGGRATVSWSVGDATICTGIGAWADPYLITALTGTQGYGSSLTNYLYNDTEVGVQCDGQGGGFAKKTLQIKVAPPNNDAQCVGTKGDSQVQPGAQFNTTVIMKNTGNSTWYPAATFGQMSPKLGSQPQDNMVWGLNRVSMPPFYAISPGQQVAFNFTATAPTTPGVYPFNWKMVQEGVAWFGATCTQNIQVGNSAVAPAGTPTITVLTPIGTETNFAAGGGVFVSWQESGFTPKDMRIYLNNVTSGTMVTLASLGNSAATTYATMFPSNTTAGTYSISVCDAGNTISATNTKPVCGTSAPFSVAAGTAPSISLTATAGSNTGSSVTANVGTTFTISGVPQNIQGLAYYYGTGNPPAGYYNRAFFFDQTFSNNNHCGNDLWSMTCTATVPGTSNFYVEIYANGQTYRSNTVSVTIPASTTSAGAPKMSSASPSSFQAGTQATVIVTGANFVPGLTVSVAGPTGTSTLSPIIQSSTSFFFIFPFSTAGTYTVTASTPAYPSASSLTMTVYSQPPPQVSVLLTQSAINGPAYDTTYSNGTTGQPFTLGWSSTNAASCSMSKVTPSNTTDIVSCYQNQTSGYTGNSMNGSCQPTPIAYGRHTFIFTCTDASGNQQSATVYHTVLQGTVSLGATKQLAGVAGAFAEPTNAAAAAAPPSGMFTLDLYRGQSGPQVAKLQQVLASLGLYKGDVTAEFFDQTREAVIAFQLAHYISPTGYVGAETRAALNALGQ